MFQPQVLLVIMGHPSSSKMRGIQSSVMILHGSVVMLCGGRLNDRDVVYVHSYVRVLALLLEVVINRRRHVPRRQSACMSHRKLSSTGDHSFICGRGLYRRSIAFVFPWTWHHLVPTFILGGRRALTFLKVLSRPASCVKRDELIVVGERSNHTFFCHFQISNC